MEHKSYFQKLNKIFNKLQKENKLNKRENNESDCVG